MTRRSSKSAKRRGETSSEWREQLDFLRERFRFWTKVAEEVGISYATLNSWLDHPEREPREDQVLKIKTAALRHGWLTGTPARQPTKSDVGDELVSSRSSGRAESSSAPTSKVESGTFNLEREPNALLRWIRRLGEEESEMRRTQVFAGAVLLLVLVVVGLKLYGFPKTQSGKGPQTVATSVGLDQGMIPVYLAYSDATYVFIAMQGRAPTNFEELASSPYLIAPPDRIINPYTGRPVKNSAEPSAGDMNIHFEGRNSTVDDWIMGLDGKIKTGILGSAGSLGREAQIAFQGRDQEKLGPTSDTKAYIRSLSPKDQRAYFICRTLQHVAPFPTIERQMAQPDLPQFPASLDEMLHYYVLQGIPVLNPFTGAPVKEVPEGTDSPGDVVYYRFYYEDGKLSRVIPMCIGSDGKLLSPAMIAEVEHERGPSIAGSIVDGVMQWLKNIPVPLPGGGSHQPR